MASNRIGRLSLIEGVHERARLPDSVKLPDREDSNLASSSLGIFRYEARWLRWNLQMIVTTKSISWQNLCEI